MEKVQMANQSSTGGSDRGFAKDPEKAAEAGRKGGEHSHGQQQGGAEKSGEERGGSEHRGGSGNFAEDREKASEAGRKGGQR